MTDLRIQNYLNNFRNFRKYDIEYFKEKKFKSLSYADFSKMKF